MKHYKKHKAILENFLFPLLLLLLPLWNMNVGIDLADTTYSLANYEYFGKTDQMWFFSTFLANVIGLGLTKLPLGNTLLGMNFYTSFLFLSEKEIPSTSGVLGRSMCYLFSLVSKHHSL